MKTREKINRLFIANRAEIASRIINTAQKMGITCIVPYTWADKDLPFVAQADVTCLLLENPATAYRNGPALLQLAKENQADAIHPGYGFLSENAAFAKGCDDANIIFVGPSAQHIDLAGDKARAKKKMKELGLPILESLLLTEDLALESIEPKILKTVGLPCILKPVAGGGGKGMHVVETPESLSPSIHLARREALNIFGDATLMVEKFCPNPRHIEVQVFGDVQGHAVHLFERNCSLQRRHQKVVEEAGSPGLSNETRQNLYTYATQAVQGLGYVNAGTVEFLVDAQDQIFFLEMNTRLQVEHPVTEKITGQDLVRWQLQVAQGAPLPLAQHEINAQGHAIEGRLYAEDPANNFQPSIGALEVFETPNAALSQSLHHRLDEGYAAGAMITPFYDPMLAKIIVWGEDRRATIENFRQALHHYRVYGVTTNLSLLEAVTHLPAFLDGSYTTASLDGLISKLKQGPCLAPPKEIVALVARFHLKSICTGPIHGPWHEADEPYLFWLHHKASGATYTIESHPHALFINGEAVDAPNADDQSIPIYTVPDGYVAFQGYAPFFFATRFVDRTFSTDAADNCIKAPLPGTIRHLYVTPGQRVKANAPLLTLEAMKTEYVFKAPHDIKIEALHAQKDQFVQEGTVLLAWA